MRSPIAHCKQSVVLLVVSLFLLGCAVPSAVGSTIDIRRQSEDNKGLSKHNTTRNEKRGTKSASLEPCCPCLQDIVLRSLGMGIEPRTLKRVSLHLPTRVPPVLSALMLKDGIDILVRAEFSVCCGILRHAAACFKKPTKRPQNQVLRHFAACCGMLQPLVSGWDPCIFLPQRFSVKQEYSMDGETAIGQ